MLQGVPVRDSPGKAHEELKPLWNVVTGCLRKEDVTGGARNVLSEIPNTADKL